MSVMGYWEKLYRAGEPKSERAREIIMPRECYCVGPQNGEPRCPCRMRDVVVRDGRYIEPERDLGPVTA